MAPDGRRTRWPHATRLTCLALSFPVLTSCSPDLVTTPLDAAAGRSSGPDAGVDATAIDAGETADAAQGAPDAVPSPARRLLLSYSTPDASEVAAFGLGSGGVDGRLLVPSSPGTTVVTPAGPWLLEPAGDVVARLDPLEPWVVRSSWNVALDDAVDGGEAHALPDAIVAGPGSKAYVLRYARNLVAVLDGSEDADAGAPLKTVDLSGGLQPGGDGVVEMIAGSYDAQAGRVYVLLGSTNRSETAPDGTFLCASTHPALVAIDTETDTLVGADGGVLEWALEGFAPPPGPSTMVYDAAGRRLVVLESGCREMAADGGVGPIVRREVEAVSLVDGSTQTLLDLSSAAAPRALYPVDATHFVLELDTAYLWDATTSTLGPPVANAPLDFALDGRGNLVGVTAAPGDAGEGGWAVVSVSLADAGAAVLGTDPFSLSHGAVTGAQLWPFAP